MAASQCSAAGYRCHLQHLADPSKESTPDRRRPLRNGWRHIPDTPIAFIHRFHPSLSSIAFIHRFHPSLSSIAFIHRWAMRATLVTIVSTMSRHPPAIRLVQLDARTACCVAAATDRLLLAGRRSAIITWRRSAPLLLNLAWVWPRPVMQSTCSMVGL